MAGAFVGVNYGTRGINLPVPADVVQLLKSLDIGYVRIFDANASVMSQFGGSGIQLWIAVQNQEILGLGLSNDTAAVWVRNNVVQLVAQSVNISGITVGEEVLTEQDASIVPYLLPAMTNLHAALVAARLDGQVKVSTAHAVGVLATTYPPYEARFNGTLLGPVVAPLLAFLRATGSYLMVNLYPISDYQHNQVVSLDYALFRPNAGSIDPNTQLHYYSQLDALLDAFYFAMEAAANVTDLPVVVASTGWPSAGDASERGVSVVNAQTYNQNLIKRARGLASAGTPYRPGLPVSVLIYEIFNEGSLPGPTSARNWGVYYPNLTAVYPLDWTGAGLAPNATAASWCVAKDGVSTDALQNGLDWACGPGEVDCRDIQQSGKCYLPNTVASHASWAFNAYYAKNANQPGTCDFSGTANIVYSDPSKCCYPTN